jgi:hypothetical protein
MLQTRTLFPLGRIVATPGALNALQDANQQAQEFLSRHVHGDWGDLTDEDWKENNFSVTRALRLLSAYHLTNGETIWIIAEADRLVTTLLLPSEY